MAGRWQRHKASAAVHGFEAGKRPCLGSAMLARTWTMRYAATAAAATGDGGHDAKASCRRGPAMGQHRAKRGLGAGVRARARWHQACLGRGVAAR